MTLVFLSLAANSPFLIPPPPCEAGDLLRDRAVEIVKLAQEDRREEFNSLVSSDVSLNFAIGDQVFVVRNDERAMKARGDGRQQIMRFLKRWNLNSYTVRSSGIVCIAFESTGLEFRSDADRVSLFLTFDFEGSQLVRIGGEGFSASDFPIVREGPP